MPGDVEMGEEDGPVGQVVSNHESGVEFPLSCRAPDTEVLSGIQKLQGRENYSIWKFQMKSLLNYEDLWEPIGGYPDSDSTDEATKARKDAKALARINLMLAVSCICHTMRAKTAAEAWHSLENFYEEKGRVHLFQKLFSVQRKDYPSVDDYINQVIWLSEILAETGNAVDPEILGAIILRGLPDYDTYKPLILEAESSGRIVTSDLVISWIMLNHDESCDEVEEIVEEKRNFGKWIIETTTIIAEKVVRTITFTSRARAVRDSADSKRNKGKVCYNCRMRGHVAANCPNSNPNNQGPSNQSSMGQNFSREVVTLVIENVIVRGATVACGMVGGAAVKAALVVRRIFRRQ